MNDEQRDATLTEIKIRVAKMAIDIHWVKRIVGVMIIALLAIFGISVPIELQV